MFNSQSGSSFSLIVHPTGKFDNSALASQHLQVQPIAAAMGAEICGVDIRNVSDDAFSEIQAALFRHKMIYFRRQDVSAGDQEAFASRFGAFAEDAYTQGVPGHPNVQPVVREADEKGVMIFGSGWHTDSPFLTEPPAISMLRSIEVPPFGGDTQWANSALVFAQLSEPLQMFLMSLKVHMSMDKVLNQAQQDEINDSPIGRLAATRDMLELPQDLLKKVTGNFHPLVRKHPITGELALYCDTTYAALESAALAADSLLEQSVSSNDTRTRWVGAIVPNAWPHFEANRMDEYWAEVAGFANQVGGEYDAIFLSQASMLGAATLCQHDKVITTPKLGVQRLIEGTPCA